MDSRAQGASGGNDTDGIPSDHSILTAETTIMGKCLICIQRLSHPFLTIARQAIIAQLSAMLLNVLANWALAKAYMYIQGHAT